MPKTTPDFTFQSGYIQMENTSRIGGDKMTLHSNLVIFKSYCSALIFLPLFALHSNLVIFKLYFLRMQN